MNVELMSFTSVPEEVCAKAMRGCRSEMAAIDIPMNGETSDRMIRAAIKVGHESVLEHAVFTFSVEGVSRVLTHQLVRHRIASYSQQSLRSVKVEGTNWYILPDSVYNKGIQKDYDDLMAYVLSFYKLLIAYGVPPEDARFVLPQACKTNIVITMNARELRHFFNLRLDTSAQWEIRELAQKMLELVKKTAPVMFEDFL